MDIPRDPQFLQVRYRGAVESARISRITLPEGYGAARILGRPSCSQICPYNEDQRPALPVLWTYRMSHSPYRKGGYPCTEPSRSERGSMGWKAQHLGKLTKEYVVKQQPHSTPSPSSKCPDVESGTGEP